MRLRRISSHIDLKGIGGIRAPGRWHHRGQPVVYLAESPAAALLEVCVHTAAHRTPPAFTLLRIESPSPADITPIAESSLPTGWRTNIPLTQDLGTEWLRSSQTALLSVPSAIVPYTTNYVLNPVHPAAQSFTIAETLEYPFDPRLKL